MGEKIFQHLVSGRSYRVQKEIVDYDRKVHREGSVYRFVESGFLPYEDGLTLHFIANGRDVYMRLQWREEQKAEIIDHLTDYFVQVEN